MLQRRYFFDWLSTCQLVFENLKKIFNKVFIFAYYKQGIKTILKINSFDYISSRIFFQGDNNRLLYFVAFFSKNVNLIKCNYKIYKKKLLAIIRCFK